jgi:hypothetical protein
VEKLYAMLRVGDIVQIRAERDEEIAAVFSESPRLLRVRSTVDLSGQ